MSVVCRVFLFLSLLHTFLHAKDYSLEKALVQKGELALFFDRDFPISNIKHFTLQRPYREIYDLKSTRLAHSRVPLGLGKYVRMAQYKHNTVRVVITGTTGYKPVAYQPFFSAKEYHVTLPYGGSKMQYSGNVQQYTSAPKRQSHVSHSDELIVIDAGHGGHDTGAIGRGKREKDLVLQIAKRLETQLKKRGYPVYMTRKSDRFLKLSQRTKIADQKNAMVFISIHANSVPKHKRNKIQGVETFFLQKTRDAKSQRIAERENNAVLKGTTKLSRKVILDSVLSGPKIVESNKLAIDVQRHMISNLRSRYRGVKDGGVRHAPFWVLVGASRPSILVEVGYISHPKERKRLFTPRYQQLLVNGMAEGIETYLKNRKREIDL